MVLPRPRTVKFHPSSVLATDVVNFIEESEAVPTSSIKCVQVGIDRSIYVTFRDESTANDVAELDTVQINGVNVFVTMADQVRTWVKIYYLPFEVNNRELFEVLREFGNVHSVRQDRMSLHSEIFNGIRTVSMTIRKPVPSYLSVQGYQVYAFHRGQVKTCKICHRPGHLQKNCPEIRCFLCRSFGHTAKECDERLMCNYCHVSGHYEERCPERMHDENRNRKLVENEEKARAENEVMVVNEGIAENGEDNDENCKDSDENDDNNDENGKDSDENGENNNTNSNDNGDCEEASDDDVHSDNEMSENTNEDCHDTTVEVLNEGNRNNEMDWTVVASKRKKVDNNNISAKLPKR